MRSTFSKAALSAALGVALLGATPALAVDWFCIADTQTGAVTEVTEAEAEPYLATQNAWGREWYINNWALTIGEATYEKYGLPRVLDPSDLTYYTQVEGVPIYHEAGGSAADVIYVLERSRNCEMQPYARKLN